MKLLRNPVVVGLLALVALALVGNSIYQQMRRAPRRISSPPTPTASAPAPVTSSIAVTSPKPKPPTNVPLEQSRVTSAGQGPSTNPGLTAIPIERPDAAGLGPVDLDIIHADAARWAQGRRDPFQIRRMAAKPVFPPAREVLALSAIWRQTDSSLAVLNNRIYAAGDRVLRYTLQSIESDRVWVQGPNGLEFLEFKSAPLTRTNLLQNQTPLGSNVGVSTNP